MGQSGSKKTNACRKKVSEDKGLAWRDAPKKHKRAVNYTRNIAQVVPKKHKPADDHSKNTARVVSEHEHSKIDEPFVYSIIGDGSASLVPDGIYTTSSGIVDSLSRIFAINVQTVTRAQADLPASFVWMLVKVYTKTLEFIEKPYASSIENILPTSIHHAGRLKHNEGDLTLRKLFLQLLKKVENEGYFMAYLTTVHALTRPLITYVYTQIRKEFACQEKCYIVLNDLAFQLFCEFTTLAMEIIVERNLAVPNVELLLGELQKNSVLIKNIESFCQSARSQKINS